VISLDPGLISLVVVPENLRSLGGASVPLLGGVLLFETWFSSPRRLSWDRGLVRGRREVSSASFSFWKVPNI